MIIIYLKLDIPKIEERYIIYENGEIFDTKRKKYCRKRINKKGYHRVYLNNIGKNVYVHRLVLCKYCPVENEIYLQVNHKNGNKIDNRLENLEWVTQSENIKHAFNNNLVSRIGTKNSQNKLTVEDVQEIIQKLLQEVPLHIIAKDYNVSKSLIGRIRSKRAWVELTKDIVFPKSKFSNHCKTLYIEMENELINDLQNNIDIDVLSEKYHLSKRFIRDFKYRKLGIY